MVFEFAMLEVEAWGVVLCGVVVLRAAVCRAATSRMRRLMRERPPSLA